MPFCEPCDKWRAPNALMPDGTCPRCRTVVQEPPAVDPAAADATKIPWHFWVMVAAAGLYLMWRVIEGVSWFF